MPRVGSASHSSRIQSRGRLQAGIRVGVDGAVRSDHTGDVVGLVIAIAHGDIEVLVLEVVFALVDVHLVVVHRVARGGPFRLRLADLTSRGTAGRGAATRRLLVLAVGLGDGLLELA